MGSPGGRGGRNGRADRESEEKEARATRRPFVLPFDGAPSLRHALSLSLGPSVRPRMQIIRYEPATIRRRTDSLRAAWAASVQFGHTPTLARFEYWTGSWK